MAAGMATLDGLSQPGFFADLEQKTAQLVHGLKSLADEAGVPMATEYAGGMFGFFFSELDKVTSFAEATACDADTFNRFFHSMLDQGVYLAPSLYEAGFISAAHSLEDLDRTLAAAKVALRA